MEDSHVETKAKIGVMLPQNKEPEEPPEVGRDKEELSSRAFRGSMSLPIS